MEINKTLSALNNLNSILSEFKVSLTEDLEKLKSELSEAELKDLENTKNEFEGVLNKILKHGN
jgi:hypothetical protein